MGGVKVDNIFSMFGNKDIMITPGAKIIKCVPPGNANLFIPESVGFLIYSLGDLATNYLDEHLPEYYELAKRMYINSEGMEVSILSNEAFHEPACPYRRLVDEFFESWEKDLTRITVNRNNRKKMVISHFILLARTQVLVCLIIFFNLSPVQQC